MKIILIFTLLLAYTTSLFAQTGSKEEKSPNKISSYSHFIQHSGLDPVDYIFHLFEKYDVVILGERDHRDTTQYELICDLISDPRFKTSVKNILTEIGGVNYTPEAQRLIQTHWENDSIFDQHLVSLLQNATFIPYWEKYNFPKLLKHLYKCNADLSEKEKLNIYFTDVLFSWESMTTKKEYEYFKKHILCKRDSMMARHATHFIDSLLQKKEKALIIYNEPHARIKKSKQLTSAAFYIATHYPGHVANIRINDVEFSRRESEKHDRLIEGGKWDAAFKICNYPNTGFYLKSSPFGKDKFHTLKNRKLKNANWEDVYTGFIYYQPFYKWTGATGYPGVITEEFVQELNRRYSILSGKKVQMNKEDYIRYNSIQTFPIYPPKIQKSFTRKINRYL